MPKNEMKKLMSKVLRRHPLRGTDWLLRRQVEARLIAMNVTNGEIRVVTWWGDCDGCEGTSISTLPASVMAYEKFCNRAYEHREGPMSFHILSPEQAEEFEVEFYDRAAERAGY